MKVYIAAPWVDRELARIFAQQCDDRGIEITHRWWNVEGEYSDIPKMLECAIADRNGVDEADALILFNTQKSEGKAVEQGLAIAWNKPIVVVGTLHSQSRNVFHFLPNYTWVNAPSDVWEVLLDLRRRNFTIGR